MGGGSWTFLFGGVICLVNSVDDRDLRLQNGVYFDSYLITSWRSIVYNARKFKARTGVRCSSMFYVMPWWLLVNLILSGPICVDCKFNLALDSAGAELPEKRFDCSWDG